GTGSGLAAAHGGTPPARGAPRRRPARCGPVRYRETPQRGPLDEADGDGAKRPSPMLKSESRRKKTPGRVLALPDLEQAKTAVLNRLASNQRPAEAIVARDRRHRSTPAVHRR